MRGALLAVLALCACGDPRFDVGEPFTVAFTAPSHGAAAIDVDTDVRIGFNLPVDRESVAANITLAAGEDPLELSLLFADGDRVVVLVPVRTLPAGQLMTLSVGPDVESSGGTDLDTTLTADFTTAQ